MRRCLRALAWALTLLLILSGCYVVPQPVSYELGALPDYTGEPWVPVNGNEPFFTEISDSAFEAYSSLDELGRCGPAYACVGVELMPTEEREDIGSVRPSGWHTVRYDGLVEGKYLYNRCHLIGFQLTGENANKENLITGTRYLNIQGMLPFENRVAEYVRETENHVLYRVTPIFEGTELVARGVLMEGLSVEDGGRGVRFCVYAYNVQPEIHIDYATGESWVEAEGPPSPAEETPTVTYVGNKNTMKFHTPDCPSAEEMKPQNRVDFYGDREEPISLGYEPCGRCQP